jgi:hypothetical protein
MSFVDTGAATADQQFWLTHGMTREQMAERERVYERSRFEEKALKGYDADVAGKTARQRLANFVEWLGKTTAEESALKAKGAQLQAAIAAPAQAKAKRDGLLRSMAKKLLGADDGGSQGFDLLQRRTLDTEIDAAEHHAEIAKLALVDLDEQVDIARLRVERLRGRRHEFVTDAMQEHLRETLVPEYRKTIDSLRNVVHRIDAARRASGMAGLHDAIRLPALSALDRDAVIGAAEVGALEEWCTLLRSWGVL